jgi:hypothetical protein
MTRAFCRLVPVLALVVSAACGSSPSQPSAAPATSEQLVVKVTTAHFRVLGDRTDPAVLRAVADALEAAYPRVTADLRTGDVPLVSASVWTDSTSYYDAMRRNTGQLYSGSAGYIVDARNLCVLAVPSVARNATHEFTHLVSMAVNPRIPNNPRWLWETVALYENGEFVDPNTLDYMRAGRYPTLAELDADFNTSHQIYDVGYVLGEFIVAAWGADGLIRLIQRNGDLPIALGTSTAEFESRWHAFLQAKYGLPAYEGA